MNDFRDTLNDQFRNEELEMECGTEFDIIQALIEARKQLNVTQEELSARTGICQGNISRIETGLSNPSIKMLQRLASGLGMTLDLKKVCRQP